MNDNYEQECCSFWLLEYPENVINFSPSIIKLLGYKPEDLGSFPDFMDHVNPDDKRFIEDSLNDLFQGKSDKYKARYRIKNASGNYIWCLDRGAIIRKDDKKIFVSGHITDLQKQKENDEEFRTIAENTSDGIMIFEDQKIKYVSPSYKFILGYSENEVIGRTEKEILDLIHPDDLENVKDIIYGAIENKKTNITYQFRARTKHGYYIWREDNAHLIYDEFGNYRKAYVVARDITEQKNADKSMIESEKRHKAIVKALPDIIFRFNSDYLFIDVNYNDFNKPYKPPDSFLGKHVQEILPPDIAETTIKHIDIALESGELQIYQYSINIDGKDRIFDARMVVSGENEVLVIVRDLTEDKLRQKALQENEELFRTLFTTMPDIVFRADMQGNLLYVNDNGVKLSGYTKEELKDMNVFSFIAPEEREAAFIKTQLMIEKQLGPQIYNLISKTGDRIPFEVNGDVLRDENGVPYGMVHVCRNISERLRAEEESKKQKKLFEQVLTASSVGLALAKDRKVIWANKAMEDLFGYTSKDNYMGKDTSMIYASKEDYYRVQELVYEGIREKKQVRLDLQFKRKDGSLFWGHYKINPLDPDDPLAGTIVSLIDISDRKLAEEKLKENQEILNDIFNSVNEGIIHTDLAGNLIAVNDAVEKITGIKKHELINRNSIILATKFLTIKNVSKIIPIVNSVIKGKEIKPFELEFNGKILEINTRYNSTSKRITGTLRDITDQKTFEHELVKAKEKAEESDKLKTAFLQNLSHEVRTPLNGIIGFTSLITDPENDKEIIEESWRMIKISSDRLIALIENVITLSEIETGQKKIVNEYFSPYDVIADIEKTYKDIAEAKGLKFITSNYRGYFDHSILSDRTAVIRIMSLLADNAIKFTDTGSITIGYDMLDNKEFCIYVNDTGIGISSNDIGRIFNKFEKLNSASNWMTPGTGIGLTIAKGLTEHIGARLEVESKLRHGSSFKLFIMSSK
jgi:PAS domain S-box-containing protein